MKLYKSLSTNIPRPFVKFPQDATAGRIEILRQDDASTPRVSIIIPSIGAARKAHIPQLLEQIQQQTFQNFEIILIIGDTRQGRAINSGAALAQGKYIVTFDDDTRLGRQDLLEKMIAHMEKNPDIGMAGVANTIPQDASFFVRRIMRELPRRSSPIVDTITESDLAEHPCCIIPRRVFIEVGGENELIPRGLDPYLRREIRHAGYRVVVLPELFIHHLPPATIGKFIKQFYRNGKMAAYVNKFYPQFVVELTTNHNQSVGKKRTLLTRIATYKYHLIKALLTGKLIYFLSLSLYLCGFLYGYATFKKNDV